MSCRFLHALIPWPQTSNPESRDEWRETNCEIPGSMLRIAPE